MRRLLRIGATFGAATLAAFMLLVATPAYAHSYLVESNPAEGEVLTELPLEFSVTTNETLLDLAGDNGGFAIQVTNDAGQYFGDGCVSVRDRTLATGATLGAAGDYLLRWQFVSADGHPVSGEIAFGWQPDANQTISDGLAAPPACGGGTLDGPTTEDSDNSADGDSAEVVSPADASTVIVIAAGVSLVLVAAVAVFLISVKRRKNEG